MQRVYPTFFAIFASICMGFIGLTMLWCTDNHAAGRLDWLCFVFQPAAAHVYIDGSGGMCDNCTMIQKCTVVHFCFGGSHSDENRRDSE